MDNQETWTAEGLMKFLEGETIQERTTHYCGGRHISMSPEGGMSMGVHRCQQHRTCQFCYDIRKGEFESRLRRDDSPNDLIAIVVDEETAKKFLRSKKVSSNDYLRTPMQDGENVTIIISKEIADSVGSFEYDKWAYVFVNDGKEINSTILEIVSNLPEGKRTSGNLGKIEKKEKEDVLYPEPENDDDVFDAIVPRFLINSTEERTIAEAFFVAIKETSNQRPTTGDEMNSTLMERGSIFQSVLSRDGIENMVIRYSMKRMSLKWALENFITIQEIKPDVQITLNSNIGNVITPMSRTLVDVLSNKIGHDKVKSIPIS